MTLSHPFHDAFGQTPSVSPELTPREIEVLALTARGSTNRDIARDLGVSEHTVKFHLGGVYRKLSVTNRTEATATYFRLNGRQA